MPLYTQVNDTSDPVATVREAGDSSITGSIITVILELSCLVPGLKEHVYSYIIITQIISSLTD